MTTTQTTTNANSTTNTNSTTDTVDTDPTTTLAVAIDAHLAGYCEPDAARRADLLASAWADDGTLVDPPFDGQGLEAIAGMADVLLHHYAGHTFRRTTAVDVHHTFARYGWELIGPDGAVAVDGTDFVELDAAGRIHRIVGFFGPLAVAT
jgi:hypothetical protein